MTLKRINATLASWLRVLFIFALSTAMIGCANVELNMTTYNAPLHLTGAGGVTNFPSNNPPRQQIDAKNAIALNNATNEIALLGAEEDKVYQAPGCPIFKRPEYVQIPGIPLKEINAVPEDDTNRKLEIIIVYTQNLRQWIIKRREIHNEAYAKYSEECKALTDEKDKDAKRR